MELIVSVILDSHNKEAHALQLLLKIIHVLILQTALSTVNIVFAIKDSFNKEVGVFFRSPHPLLLPHPLLPHQSQLHQRLIHADSFLILISMEHLANVIKDMFSLEVFVFHLLLIIHVHLLLTQIIMDSLVFVTLDMFNLVKFVSYLPQSQPFLPQQQLQLLQLQL